MNTPNLQSTSSTNSPTKSKTTKILQMPISTKQKCKGQMSAPCHEVSAQLMCYHVMKEFLKIMLQNSHSYSHGMDNQENTVARDD